MQRLFLIAWSAVVIVVIALMVLLYVSLIPHFDTIGDFASVALIVVLGCGVSLAVGFTFYTLKKMRIQSQVLTHGEVMVFRKRDGTFEHLSAEHVRAGVPLPPVTVKELPSPSRDETIEDLILQMYDKGQSLRSIERELRDKKITYYQIQKVVSENSPTPVSPP
jgi:hypothetical protein